MSAATREFIQQELEENLAALEQRLADRAFAVAAREDRVSRRSQQQQEGGESSYCNDDAYDSALDDGTGREGDVLYDRWLREETQRLAARRQRAEAEAAREQAMLDRLKVHLDIEQFVRMELCGCDMPMPLPAPAATACDEGEAAEDERDPDDFFSATAHQRQLLMAGLPATSPKRAAVPRRVPLIWIEAARRESERAAAREAAADELTEAEAAARAARRERQRQAEAQRAAERRRQMIYGCGESDTACASAAAVVEGDSVSSVAAADASSALVVSSSNEKGDALLAPSSMAALRMASLQRIAEQERLAAEAEEAEIARLEAALAKHMKADSDE